MARSITSGVDEQVKTSFPWIIEFGGNTSNLYRSLVVLRLRCTVPEGQFSMNVLRTQTLPFCLITLLVPRYKPAVSDLERDAADAGCPHCNYFLFLRRFWAPVRDS
jgi:hypothetical protein